MPKIGRSSKFKSHLPHVFIRVSRPLHTVLHSKTNKCSMKGDASQAVGDADYHLSIVYFYAFAKKSEFEPFSIFILRKN